MASIRLTGAACAGLLAFASTTAATAQIGPALSPAATVWQLRSGLNVAALACRGAGEQAIVAGYNRLLADHRAELAGIYQQVSREYGSAAAFDEAMTRLYNSYAQPAAQAVLCANAEAVLDRVAAQGDHSLGEFANAALAQLHDAGPPRVMTQVAVAAIPQIVDERPPLTRDPRWREREDRWEERRDDPRWGERDHGGEQPTYRDDDRRDPRDDRDDRDEGTEEAGPGDE